MPDELSSKEKMKIRARVLIPTEISLLRHYDYKLQKIELEKKYDQMLRDQPVEFKFYCSYCLHQTNEHAETCPKCNEGKLVETGREPR